MQAAQQFWLWFQQHEEEYLRFEQDLEPRFDRLQAALGKVQEGLTFEFGPPEDRRELILSADGIGDRFPAVVALKDAAPDLPRWQIIAFRPRRFELGSIRIGDILVTADTVECSLATDGNVAGLYLFLPDGIPQEPRLQIGYLLLDEALGEFDVETRLGLIEILPRSSNAGYDRFLLSELAPKFDALVAQLEGRGSKPS
jgi:hypothetical protein